MIGAIPIYILYSFLYLAAGEPGNWHLVEGDRTTATVTSDPNSHRLCVAEQAEPSQDTHQLSAGINRERANTQVDQLPYPTTSSASEKLWKQTNCGLDASSGIIQR